MALPLGETFDDSPPLHIRSRISNASFNAEQTSLIQDITTYVGSLKSEIKSLKRQLEANEEGGHAAKKRKLESTNYTIQSPTTGEVATTTGCSWIQESASFEAADISFSVPVRKKMKLEIVDGRLPAQGGIRVRSMKPNDTENDMAVSWTDIEQIICVPVPEKMQPTYNFIIIPKQRSSNTGHASTTTEPLVFNIPSNPIPIKSLTISPNNSPTTTSYQSVSSNNTYPHLLHTLFNTHLNHLTPSKHTITPTDSQFKSSIIQPHRKTETAYHVKAFRGSKDGFLFFLPPGILFGFRKPILFFPFASIQSISYSSVLQRTFNLNLNAFVDKDGLPSSTSDPGRERTGANGEEKEEGVQEFEFSMLDQADYAGIDEYIKRHGLNDASLAEGRRAKIYNVNAPKSGDGGEKKSGANGVVDGDGEGELAKAERAIQDAEDEEEEDYDPSGGESEGSGSDSEDEDDGREGDGDEDEEVEEFEEEEEGDDELN